jgi:hypothetical protein
MSPGRLWLDDSRTERRDTQTSRGLCEDVYYTSHSLAKLEGGRVLVPWQVLTRQVDEGTGSCSGFGAGRWAMARVLLQELKCPIQVNWNQGLIPWWSYWITSNSVELCIRSLRISAVSNNMWGCSEATFSYRHPNSTIMTVLVYSVTAVCNSVVTNIKSISKGCIKKSVKAFAISCIVVNSQHCNITLDVPGIDVLDSEPLIRS